MARVGLLGYNSRSISKPFLKEDYMKKLVALLMAVCMTVALAACGGSSSSGQEGSGGSSGGSTTDVAFVTDVGNIDDQSFNQYTWAGVQEFAKAQGLKANYYKPSEDSDAARVEQMDNAIKDGAKVVVMAGYLFAPSLEEAQAKYPDTSFLAIDVSTGDLANPGKNTALFTYKEEQVGYLAGYAAVKDGYKKLGFLGGMAVPAVIRYGYGYVQGAEQAAKDMGLTDVSMKYWYCGSFSANDDIKAKMDSWYAEGTEVVFACGGSICQSCLAAAQANGGKMIGVDVDQSYLDPEIVITSAMKALSHSVVMALEDAQANGWKFSEKYAGKETKLGAAEDGVSLEMTNAKFKTFTQEDYDKLFQGFVDGTLTCDGSSDDNVKPAVSTISVEYIQ